MTCDQQPFRSFVLLCSFALSPRSRGIFLVFFSTSVSTMSKLLLHIAAGCGDVQTLKELLSPFNPDEDEDEDDGDYQPKDWRSKINKRNCVGETPLHIACLSGQVEAAEFLLQNGAKLFPIQGFFSFFSSLLFACSEILFFSDKTPQNSNSSLCNSSDNSFIQGRYSEHLGTFDKIIGQGSRSTFRN